MLKKKRKSTVDEYNQLNPYQQELVSYTLNNSNMGSYPEVITWLDEHCIDWRNQDGSDRVSFL